MVADEALLKYEAGLISIWYEKGKYPEIKVTREKKAKSFYGALDLKTGREYVHVCNWQDSHQTVKFLKKIKRKNPGSKILILWDGASHHKGEVREYLKQEHQKHHWLELKLFPPYSPKLNPQEKVWREARKEICHNHEDDFETLVCKFYNFLTKRKFKSSFLDKYR